jgi:hypothetical protein
MPPGSRLSEKAYLTGTPIVISTARNGRECDQEVMEKFSLASAYGVALVLGLVACGNTDAQTAKTGGANVRSSHRVVSCKKDSQCPSGQRCGFTSGCEGKGQCVVPSGDSSCIDPGGRCGCDGRPVDIFCAVGSRTEFSTAPVGSVGPCPIPCTEDAGCPHHLVCRKGICAQSQNGRSD